MNSVEHRPRPNVKLLLGPGRACFLARRPGHGAAAKYVQMQVKDSLPDLFAVVDHQAKGIGEPFLSGDLWRRSQQMT